MRVWENTFSQPCFASVPRPGNGRAGRNGWQRFRTGRRFALAAAAGLAAGRASAQGGWPERPVTIVVCFPPGGSTDFSARMVAPGLSELLGKPVVIENRAGAGGNIGIGVVARAQPDGYTLLVASSVFVVNASLYRNAPYDPFRDFAPVGTLGASPNLICVRRIAGSRASRS